LHLANCLKVKFNKSYVRKFVNIFCKNKITSLLSDFAYAFAFVHKPLLSWIKMTVFWLHRELMLWTIIIWLVTVTEDKLYWYNEISFLLWQVGYIYVSFDASVPKMRNNMPSYIYFIIYRRGSSISRFMCEMVPRL
jgi:hypothetical protein